MAGPTLDGIAVIGMAGQFPQADTIDQFWQNLINGKDCISSISIDEARSAGIPETVINQKNYVRRGGRIKNAGMFDASFFGFSPKDAKFIDPQQRLFLKCGWEAIESAGYDVTKLNCSVGVFGSCSFNYYLLNNLINNPAILSDYSELQTLFSSDKDFLTTRLSYKLNLKGPSFTVQSACSSSLVALHIACQNLLIHQCDLALAGGVSLQIPWWKGYLVGDADIRSPDGICRPFDKSANGTIFGEGVGIVVLKRLEEAVHDGDHIFAVIKGSAINNDGSLKAGYTAPSVDGQADAIMGALEFSEVNESEVTYIETHGTGTPLGDPVEISALSKAYGRNSTKKNYCAIGSVKASIGHLDAAAGIAGLIKTVLALHHKQIPPSINFEEPNPLLNIEDSPFYVVKEKKSWIVPPGMKRIAGVSSLGVGGTNAHIILEEAPELHSTISSKKWHVLPISAKSKPALIKIAKAYSSYLNEHSDFNIADIAYTMQQGRQQFPYRHFIVTDSTIDAGQKFSSLITEDSINESITNHPKLVFMFSGQGSQYLNMGKNLYQENSIFKDTFEDCCNHLTKYSDIDFLKLIFSDKESDNLLLQQTHITQPLLFAFEYSVSKMWQDFGIFPSAMIGHSIGEYVAACLSGVFSLEDALFLVTERGKIMYSQPQGKMLSVNLSVEDLLPLISNTALEIALVNSPTLCCIAGVQEDIEAIKSTFSEKGITFQQLHTSHAFHSKLMKEAVQPFEQLFSKISLHKPSHPFISNVSGTWIKDSEALAPEYWANHIRNTVNFSSGINQLLENGYQVFIEIGPGNSLSTLVNRTVADSAAFHNKKKITVLSTVRHAKSNTNDMSYFLHSLGGLWQNGISVDWSKLYPNEKRWRVPLPTYQFDEKKHWIDPVQNIYYGMGIPLNPPKPDTNNYNNQAKSALPADTTVIRDITKSQISDTTKTILKIWQSVLGTEEIALSSSFFELGGDSLLAVQMFSKIQQKTGVNLPLATLFDSPSINELSAKLETILLQKNINSNQANCSISVQQKEKKLSYIVPIKATGNSAPFFCIHSIGGNVLNYNCIVPYLDKGQPLFGIQCRGLNGIERPFESVDIMAKNYIEEIRQIQPTGPYLLGGGSMGGLVAFEMAQQLQKEGDSIGLLLMIDSGCPYNVNKIIKQIRNNNPETQKRRPLLTQIKHSVSCRISDTKRLTLCKWYQSRRIPIPHELRYWYIEQKHLALVNSYIPKPYDGLITMFRATQNTENPDPDRGWKNVAKGGITFFDFDCNHFNMTEQVEVAKKINEVLFSFRRNSNLKA